MDYLGSFRPWLFSLNRFLNRFINDGGFNNQPQQLMFCSGVGEFHIVQEFAVTLYR